MLSRPGPNGELRCGRAARTESVNAQAGGAAAAAAVATAGLASLALAAVARLIDDGAPRPITPLQPHAPKLQPTVRTQAATASTQAATACISGALRLLTLGFVCLGAASLLLWPAAALQP